MGFMMESYLQNRLLKELLLKSEVTEENLKKIYRDLCKKTHPDITGKSGGAFNDLQKEYREAVKYLSDYESISSDKIRQPRMHLFKCLRDYVSYGLYASRIRNKPKLRQRNETLLKEIISMANIYDREFLGIFMEYNKVHVKKLNEWDLEKKIKGVRKLFLNGLNCFLDYESNGNVMSYRACKSYIDDCICEINLIGIGQSLKTVYDFSSWILKEIEKPPVMFSV
jgi:hypothetical protein